MNPRAIHKERPYTLRTTENPVFEPKIGHILCKLGQKSAKSPKWIHPSLVPKKAARASVGSTIASRKLEYNLKCVSWVTVWGKNTKVMISDIFKQILQKNMFFYQKGFLTNALLHL